MILWNRLIRNLVLSAGLFMALAGSSAAKEYSFPCPDSECIFLPLVSKPPPVRVFEYQTYGSRAIEVWLVGDVITTSNKPVYDVQIEFRIYDSAGQLAASKVTSTVLDATLPEQPNPFHVTTGFVWEEGISYDVAITGLSLESVQEYRPVTTNIIGTEDWQYGTRVYIEARNDESIPLAQVYGTAWSLEQGDPSGRRLLSTCLAPGETATFSEFLWSVQGLEIATIQAAAQGVVEPCEP